MYATPQRQEFLDTASGYCRQTLSTSRDTREFPDAASGFGNCRRMLATALPITVIH